MRPVAPWLLAFALLLAPMPAAVSAPAAPQAHSVLAPVTKQTFSLPGFTFTDGRRMPVSVGYEVYGQLNEARDNAILVCHFFGGTSHAAGRYDAKDPRAGYWDTLIGPGKALDTRRFCVIASDVPSNINRGDQRVVSTGPGTLDPETGKPYGSRFPRLQVRDMVGVQHALAGSLGITRWHAVMGASLGGMQALQWGVSHPEAVARVVAIAAPGRTDPYAQGMLQIMIDAIQADGRYQGGDYPANDPPKAGLKAAWKLMYAQILSRPLLAERLRPSVFAAERADFLNELEAQAEARVGAMDANAWVTLSRAARDFTLASGQPSYEAALGRMPARVLVMALQGDLLFPPEFVARDLVNPLKRAGKSVRFATVHTPNGHLGAITDLGKEAATIQSFISAD